MQTQSTSNQVSSSSKLQEAILYVASKCADKNLGTTKLYKLLFLADSRAYKNSHSTITGDSYVKRQFGPTPKSALPELATLEQNGDLEFTSKTIPGRYEDFELVVPVALRDADTSVFSAEELGTLDAVIVEFAGMSATRLSKITHEMPLWRWAKMNATVDMDLLNSGVRVDLSPMTPTEIEEGLTIYRKVRLA